MKIAVYSIALNEEKFIERWYNSAKEADIVLLADTGSTDNTEKICKKLGIKFHKISIKPWRFDDARNASLALIPDDIDYCIALDVDEVLVEGWRESLERATTTRPRYKYTWSWNEDGSPGLQYNGDKIHKRSGYRWKYPVHEVLSSDRIEETQEIINLEIHHYPDKNKSRSQYFPLLELSVKENPDNDRNTFYYARELYFYKKHKEAELEFKRHLSLPTSCWAPERAASMRYIGKINKEESEIWFTLAIKECPGRREPHVDLAKYYYETKQWEKCYKQATTALKIVEKPLEYLCESEAWGYTPHDMACISAYNLKMYKEAYEQAIIALDKGPKEEKERLAKNLEFCKAKIK